MDPILTLGRLATLVPYGIALAPFQLPFYVLTRYTLSKMEDPHGFVTRTAPSLGGIEPLVLGVLLAMRPYQTPSQS